MSSSEEKPNVRGASPSSSSSSSESESNEEAVVDAGDEPAQGRTAERSVQVLSAPPRAQRRASSDESDGEGGSGGGGGDGGSSSSSEAEEDAGETGEGPARGKSYLQSIRARKPKKKVYAKPKTERTENRESGKDSTTGPTIPKPPGVGVHAQENGESSGVNSLQRGINVQPTYHSDSSGSESGGEESEAEWRETSGASTQQLTQLEMEEGERQRESVFSRFNRYAGSFRVKLSSRDRKKLAELESEESDDADDLAGAFEMMSYEDQPDILKKDSSFRRRANKAISSAIADVLPKAKRDRGEEEEEEEVGLCSCFKRKKREGKTAKKPGEKKEKPPATQLSPQLQKASSQGVNMMKKVFFPALPHLLQDLWVYLEFGITMFAFIFGLLSLDLNDGSKAFNIVYLTLTIISIILAVIDCFFYFVQMGSCAECLKICYVKLKKRGEEGELELLEMEDGDQEKKGCCRMSKEKKEKFNTYFELVRNLISEAILYPLLICDLFDFIVGGVFRNISTDDHLNFTLFVIGSLYLVLAVYVMRLFLIIGSVISLSRIPTMPNASGSQGNNIRLLKWFSVHVLFQILTHALLIVSVALKIRQENPNFGEQDSIFASSFLWINVVLGGLIPIAGIISFFVTNYYHMREFSISFWIEMMAMLQAPSFTDAVFPSEDAESPSDLAEQFVKDSELKKVQKQFERYKSPGWFSKFFFPLKLPLLVTVGSLFVLGLFAFLASLILTQNPVSPTGPTVEVILFEDIPITVAFFLCGLLLMAFNFKIVVLMLVFFVLCVIFLVGMSIMVAVMLPFVVLVYFPVGCCLACVKCCKNTVEEVSIFTQPGTKVDYFNAV